MIVETTAEDYTALLDGRAPRGLALPDTPVAPHEVLAMLATVAAQVRTTFAPASWLIVEDGVIAGLCAVTRPPVDGVVDLGYGIAPGLQRRGIAGNAIALIVEWARASPGVIALTADTGVDNLPSQRVLSRNGFVRVGQRIDDEDGALICWRHALD